MGNSALEHRPAAVLAADVAGFSRLMQEDARATVTAPDECRAFLHERIPAAGGRVVDTSGDSVLAVFELATKAAQASRGSGRRLSATALPVTAAVNTTSSKAMLPSDSGQVLLRDGGPLTRLLADVHDPLAGLYNSHLIAGINDAGTVIGRATPDPTGGTAGAILGPSSATYLPTDFDPRLINARGWIVASGRVTDRAGTRFVEQVSRDGVLQSIENDADGIRYIRLINESGTLIGDCGAGCWKIRDDGITWTPLPRTATVLGAPSLRWGARLGCSAARQPSVDDLEQLLMVGEPTRSSIVPPLTHTQRTARLPARRRRRAAGCRCP